jgi:CAAX protease family protein
MTSAVSPPAERERRSLRLPILGIMVAIAITSTMDAIGLTEFSALPLFPLMLLFWRIQRLSGWSLGFTWGRSQDYGLALLYPVLVIGSVTLIAWVARALQPESANWGKVCANVALVAFSTTLVAIITEEGFFRGWLWGSLARAGKDQGGILIGTSIAFALWHISAVTFKTGFGYELPPAQVPLFVLNAALIGAAWGLVRAISGSIIVSSVSHGIWNGLAYVLFGFGTKVGALGVKDTALFGPEVGVLGLLLNLIYVAVLWRWWRVRSSAPLVPSARVVGTSSEPMR